LPHSIALVALNVFTSAFDYHIEERTPALLEIPSITSKAIVNILASLYTLFWYILSMAALVCCRVSGARVK